ncbi:hypothetical protein ACSC95_07395 [Burkholderia vietnamiensis]|uniref:hypothetical protein n=1 Tax=Burkholderia vietnamiensis TaxID=60552 RepID=UPI001B943BE5|nr:hypothetical protein [Burkholderia vietnamiensis]MBR8007032.1 hypothetical protein [Burkholderia vietnamiensis]
MADDKQTPTTDTLRGAKKQWDDLSSALPLSISLNNGVVASPDVLTDWFAFALRGVEAVESDSADPAMRAIHWPSVTSSTQQISSHMNTAKQHGAQWLSQNCGPLHSFLWQIRAALAWLLPPSLDGAEAKYPKFREILANANEVLAAAKRAAEDSEHTAQLLQGAQKASQDMADAVEKIAGHERTASTAQTNAQGSAATAEAERQRVEQYATELASATEKQRSLISEFEDYRKIVEGTIQGASKVALAKSFETRRERLETNQKNWAIVFGIGITLLLAVGVWITHEFIANPLGSSAAQVLAATTSSAAAIGSGASSVAATKSQVTGVVAAVLRFIVASPIIWLTWFAARQYGHCLRLSEDYAFKEAAAHAFVGYRNEMGDDSEMIKLLREYAIKNFGANPTRVLSKDEPATPINDIIGKAMEKVNPDKILDLLKEAMGAAKK